MAYWILQANPDIYRIFDALGDAEAIRTWELAHHHQVIAPGDEVALWASGPNSGVYAFGVVTEPAEFRPDDADPYWADLAPNEPEWRIGIRVTDVLERPIPRSEIAADPALASMLIIRMPGGGNPFPVNEAQWQAIRSHLPGERQFLPVVQGLTRCLCPNCLWNLRRDGPYRAGDGPVPWPGSLPGPWFLARVLPEAQCQGRPKAISEGNAKRP